MLSLSFCFGVANAQLQRHELRVQIGVDFGGAVPFPFSYIPKYFEPIPHIYPNVGVRYAMHLPAQFYLAVEMNYKHISLDARAVVENMHATLPNAAPDGGSLHQYFTGQASMNMDFDMLEFPIYMAYQFPNSKYNKVSFGFYAAWVFSKNFKNRPLKGFVGTEPDWVDVLITPDTDLPDEQTNFSKYLRNYDIGLIVGYERSIFSGINLGLRAQFGFIDAFKTKILDYSMLQMRGTVVVSYDLMNLFNSKNRNIQNKK